MVVRQMKKDEVRAGIEQFMENIKTELLRRLDTGMAFRTLIEPRLFSGTMPVSEMVKGFLDISVLHSAAMMAEPAKPLELAAVHKQVDAEWAQQINIIHNIICYQMTKRHENYMAKLQMQIDALRAKHEAEDKAQKDILEAATKKAAEDIQREEDMKAGGIYEFMMAHKDGKTTTSAWKKVTDPKELKKIGDRLKKKTVNKKPIAKKMPKKKGSKK